MEIVTFEGKEYVSLSLAEALPRVAKLWAANKAPLTKLYAAELAKMRAEIKEKSAAVQSPAAG